MPTLRYTWFGPETVLALRERLNAAAENAILVVRGRGKSMTLEVVAADAQVAEAAPADALNESHTCPPFCRS